MEAYEIRETQIQNGPAWLKTDFFTINATIDSSTSRVLEGLPKDQRELAQQHMLQVLLAERFHLIAHRGKKDLPIYSLVIAKNGPKLKVAKDGDVYANGVQWPAGNPLGPHQVFYRFGVGDVQMTGQGASLEQLFDRLIQKFPEQFGGALINNTGLTGTYDFVLHFRVPWPPNGSFEVDQSAVTDTPYVPSIFVAMEEQLGLRFQVTKGPWMFL
jgi:uncharacterized protein (TIGR03435 family)